MNKRVSLGLAVAGLAVTLAGIAPAAADAATVSPATSPSQCGSDYYRVINGDGAHCFANAGTLAVYITGATELCTGNNVGRVFYNDTTWSPYRAKYTCHYFTSPVTVNEIEIA